MNGIIKMEYKGKEGFGRKMWMRCWVCCSAGCVAFLRLHTDVGATNIVQVDETVRMDGTNTRGGVGEDRHPEWG